MSIVLRFASSSNANGLQALAFERSSQGVGLFFNLKQQVGVAADHATFSSITAPGEFAFRLDSAAGTRWRSGRQVLNASPTDTFMILPAGTLTFSPAAVSAMLPPVPFTSGAATLSTLALTLGTGSVTAMGTGAYASLFGTIPVTFTYVFTLVPVTEPANMGVPGFVPSAIDVTTISMSVAATAGGVLGFLVNFFAGILFSLMSGTIRASLEGAVQTAIDAAVANALASKGAPAGTIASVETLTIAPTGLSLVAFAGFALEKACASSSSGGSVKLRPREQLVHLRTIRDRLLTRSPRGAAYISLFEQFNAELASILLRNDELLRAADDIVSLALREFPIEDPGSGRVSRELADAVTKAMSLMHQAASPELKLTLAGLREEVHSFVGRPARDVLDDSFQLLEKSSTKRTDK
jgi:hypothetical protein